MKRYFLAATLATSLLGLNALVGCDREVSHTERTSHNDLTGTTTKKQTTVTEKADGSIEKTTSKQKVDTD